MAAATISRDNAVDYQYCAGCGSSPFAHKNAKSPQKHHYVLPPLPPTAALFLYRILQT